MASIRRHPRSRSWQVRYRDPSGTQRSKTFVRKADAERFAVTTESDKIRGQWVDPAGGKDPVGEWADRWLNTKRAKEQGTIDSYSSTLRTWVLPRFVSTPLDAVTVDDVIRFVVEMADSGLSASRVNQGRLVLQGVFDLAVEQKRIAANPVRSRLVRQAQPKIPTKRLRREDVPTLAEVEAIIEAAPDRWKSLLVILAYGGLRFGEAAGLRKDDVVVGGVYVDRAVKQNSLGIYMGSVKDHESRFVELPNTIIRRVRHWADVKSIGSDGLVFTTSRGGLLSVSTFHNRVWEPALAKAELADRKLHVLRAFAASFWLDTGANVEFVRSQLGNASLQTTQRYLETFRSSNESLLARLESRLLEAGVHSDVDTLWTPETEATLPMSASQ